VTSFKDVEDWIRETVSTFERLDGAANCAGVAGGNGDTTVETQASTTPLISLCNIRRRRELNATEI
jgi:hypothetical protein